MWAAGEDRYSGIADRTAPRAAGHRQVPEPLTRHLRPEARVLLAVAPTPGAAAKLTKAQIRAELKRASRQRGIDAEADRLAAIRTGFPGLARLSGARMLAEIGDDRTRFADAEAIKAYVDSAPVTRAGDKSTAVLARRVKNRRLAAVGYAGAFVALGN
jgi:hypothetical protein